MHKIASCDVFVLLDDAQYTKNGWQNRNKIKGPQGPVLLTVPVRDPAFKPINEVEIDRQTPWRSKHWKSIQLNYSKAPFFRKYSGLLEQVFETDWALLADLNGFVVRELAKAFGIGTSIVQSSSLGVPGQGTPRLVEICRKLGATRYLTGAFAAGNHLDEQLFGESGVELIIQAWACPEYRQQFQAQGFTPELSSLDLLLNEGPAGLAVLLGSASWEVAWST